MNDTHSPEQRKPGSAPLATAGLLVLAAVAAYLAGSLIERTGGNDLLQDAARVTVFVLVALKLISLRPETQDGLSFVSTVVTLGVVVVAGLRLIGLADAPPAVGCIDSEGPHQATIAKSASVIYSEPTINSPPKGLLIRGCRIKYKGYCVGSVSNDVTTEIPDARWIMLSGGQGLVASAETAGSQDEGNVPPSSDCPGNEKPLDAIDFRTAVVDPGGRRVRLVAVSAGAAFIGFSRELSADRWQRVVWDLDPDDRQGIAAQLPARARPGTVIFATPCAGYRTPVGPTSKIKLAMAIVPSRGVPRVRQPKPSVNAAAAACNAGIILKR